MTMVWQSLIHNQKVSLYTQDRTLASMYYALSYFFILVVKFILINETIQKQVNPMSEENKI